MVKNFTKELVKKYSKRFPKQISKKYGKIESFFLQKWRKYFFKKWLKRIICRKWTKIFTEKKLSKFPKKSEDFFSSVSNIFLPNFFGNFCDFCPLGRPLEEIIVKLFHQSISNKKYFFKILKQNSRIFEHLFSNFRIILNFRIFYLFEFLFDNFLIFYLGIYKKCIYKKMEFYELFFVIFIENFE